MHFSLTCIHNKKLKLKHNSVLIYNIKQNTSIMKKIYKIHDNGGRPFQVKIYDNTQVKIHKRNNQLPFVEYTPEKIFIGKSPLNKMTEFSGGHGSYFDGNSILLKISSDKYIYIGARIFSFKPYSEIIDYVSPVGNSDVPYPYAIDIDDNYYLLINHVVIKGVPTGHDPYHYYYDKILITPDLSLDIPTIKHTHFQNITEFYINDKPYTFSFDLDAAKKYDILTLHLNDDDHDDDHDKPNHLYVVKTDGLRYELSRDEYISLMNDYAKEINCGKLLDVVIIHERGE